MWYLCEQRTRNAQGFADDFETGFFEIAAVAFISKRIDCSVHLRLKTMKFALISSLLVCLVGFAASVSLPNKPTNRGPNINPQQEEEYSIHSFFDRNDKKIPTSSALQQKEQLYEAYNALHSLAQDFQKPFDAPAVVVVGHQTSGKSALIEALMGFQFNQVHLATIY